MNQMYSIQVQSLNPIPCLPFSFRCYPLNTWIGEFQKVNLLKVLN